jgi:23S rRNA (cytosine1962-C5)-methyltransferase
VQWQTHEAQARSEQLVDALRTLVKPIGIIEQVVTRNERSAPRMLWPTGELPAKVAVRENGLTFWVQFGEGLSTGLFADQRENRWRLLSMDLRGKTALNCFAYTGAFSVAAAKAGATVTSVDLSRNYLEWARENVLANGLACNDLPQHPIATEDDKAVPGQSGPKHDFIYGDVFEWLRRFAKRKRTWDLVLLDPPTFSRPKHGRAFRAERDYRDLAALAIPLVAADGWLFCSTNQRSLEPEKFEHALRDAAQQCGRVVTALEFQTVPFDFRVPTGESPYLKTFWAQLR